MKEEYNPTTFSQFSSVCNRKLLGQIKNKQVNIRDVVKYAVEVGKLEKKDWAVMDTTDAWEWLVTNPLDYKVEIVVVKKIVPVIPKLKKCEKIYDPKKKKFVYIPKHSYLGDHKNGEE